MAVSRRASLAGMCAATASNPQRFASRSMINRIWMSEESREIGPSKSYLSHQVVAMGKVHACDCQSSNMASRVAVSCTILFIIM
jgi:hypothetical protein